MIKETQYWGPWKAKGASVENNCMFTNFTGNLGANQCEAQSAYLACESVEKLTAEFLVINSMQQSMYWINNFYSSPTKSAELNAPARAAVKIM